MGERLALTRRAWRTAAAAWLLALAAACSDDPVVVDDFCETQALPLAGVAAGPVVTDVALEVQSHGIVVLATATDPQGSTNLNYVVQQIGVFPDAPFCNEPPLVVQDDLAGSGIEESFGTVVVATADPALFSAIATAQSWPVEVDFSDLDGNRTTGRVRARIIN
ncbi:MAG TPA: hypothetical protein VFZ69_05905 [Longimicrobiales bacterium]